MAGESVFVLHVLMQLIQPVEAFVVFHFGAACRDQVIERVDRDLAFFQQLLLHGVDIFFFVCCNHVIPCYGVVEFLPFAHH